MQMRKKLYIFKHFAKSNFWPISIILRLIPIENPKKSIKLIKPPNAGQGGHGQEPVLLQPACSARQAEVQKNLILRGLESA
jgi:hypothetical protein